MRGHVQQSAAFLGVELVSPSQTTDLRLKHLVDDSEWPWRGAVVRGSMLCGAFGDVGPWTP
jgi:hypothetical protein